MKEHRLLVAIVDDEEPVRRALRRLFLSAGIDVETFASAYEFLDSVRTQRPDCAVVDLHLPGMTGLDVQEHFCAAGIRVPMVIVTGNDQPHLAERALAAGASAYLRKPLDGRVLLEAVAAAVRQASLAPDPGTTIGLKSHLPPPRSNGPAGAPPLSLGRPSLKE